MRAVTIPITACLIKASGWPTSHFLRATIGAYAMHNIESQSSQNTELLNSNTATKNEASSASFYDEPPFDIAVSDNNNTVQKVSHLSRLQAAATKTKQYELVAQLSDERHEVRASKKGVDFDWVTVKVKQTSAKGTKQYSRSKPIFTDEGQMLVDNAPYDPDAYYRITVHKPIGGFSTWTNIEKVDD